MAFTVEYRPAIFAAVRTTVGYKFETTGGPFTNYRIEVEVFKASDNTSLTNGTKFSFTPNAAGITFADISSIVKAYLKAEWSNPVALNEVEPETSLKVYIKYQELYDGSATSVIDDVASPRTFVFAGLQIPSASGGDMQKYVPFDASSKFLTRFDRPKLWRGYPATLSFIFPDASGMYVIRAQYDAAGALINTETLQFDWANDDHVNRLFIDYASWLLDNAKTITLQLKGFAVDADVIGAEILDNFDFTTTIDPWTSEAGAGTDWEWIGDRVRQTALAGPSDPLEQTFAEQPAGLYQMVYDIILTDNTDQLTFKVQVFNATVLVQEILNVQLPINITSSTVFTREANILAPFDQIKIIVDNTPAANSVFGLTSFSLKASTPELLANHSFDNILAPWVSEPDAGFSWAWAAGNKANVSITSGVGYSEYLAQDIIPQPAGWYVIQMNIINAVVVQSTLIVEVWNGGVLVEQVLSEGHPHTTVAATTWNYPVNISAAFDEIKIKASYSPIGLRTFQITNISLKPAVETVFTEVLTLDVIDPCENPVMLEWKNSVGGDAWWMFDHNQEANYNYSGRKKAKRMSLSVNDLTTNEWETLNELNTLGEVYAENIVEFTALTNKTHVRNDAQVYVVNADGSKTGVIVLPTNNIMFTRQKKHTFHVEIEFPEVQ